MIFVTVGTHEQPFNRLIECIDYLKKDGLIQDEVIVQTGFSTYVPQYCLWREFLPFSEMEKNVLDARIVITHGGPASFIMPLQLGKVPIVVPRQYEFGEHVNNHQVEFAKAVSEKMGSIISIEDINKLGETIKSYDSIVKTMNHFMKSNNEKFNRNLDQIVDELL